jgi:small subunit ribosomal protein S17e
VNRIKRITLEILEKDKDKFSTDFVENKKVLDSISIIRSKELKNELAGYITKFIKREIREKEEQLEKEKQMENETSQVERSSNISEEILNSENLLIKEDDEFSEQT